MVAERIETPIDVMGVAQRVTKRLRVPSDLRDDVTQQALVYSIDLLRRFHPTEDVASPAPQIQAERYLATSLLWHLRTYLRSMRTSVWIPESDRRLARAYHRLIASEGPLSLTEAAQRLGVRQMRLAAAINAKETSLSLHRPLQEDGNSTLAEMVASTEPSPEEYLVATLEEKTSNDRRTLIGQTIKKGARGQASSSDAANNRREKQVRRLVHGFLQRLTYGDAETIRLSFALHSEDLGAVRACRAYGCRLDSTHQHSITEISRWLGCAEHVVAERLRQALDEFGDFLGGRDPRRLLRMVATNSRQSPGTPRRK